MLVMITMTMLLIATMVESFVNLCRATLLANDDVAMVDSLRRIDARNELALATCASKKVRQTKVGSVSSPIGHRGRSRSRDGDKRP